MCPDRGASHGMWGQIVAVSPFVLLTGGLAGHSQTGADPGPADAQTDGVVGEHGQLGVQFLTLEPRPADALKHLYWSEPSDPLSVAQRCRWSPHTVIRPRLYPLGQPSARSAHAASERPSSCTRLWSVDAGVASFMPKMAATRRHLSSLHRGDAAAWRRPHSRASTLCSIGRLLHSGRKERGRSGAQGRQRACAQHVAAPLAESTPGRQADHTGGSGPP